MERDPDWSIRMTAGIGKRVAAHRERQRMTVQALADKCAELGLPLGRVTITKLEGGRRQAITPAEIAVLAAALDVAPAELIYPVGYGVATEVLPGRMVDAASAARWFGGELKLELSETTAVLREPKPGEQSSVQLLGYHDDIAGEWLRIQVEAVRADHAANAEGADDHARENADFQMAAAERYRRRAEHVLYRVRDDMRQREIPLPPVPPGLRLPGEDGGPGVVLPRPDTEQDGS